MEKHVEALSRLCFACGELIDGNFGNQYFYKVEDNVELLSLLHRKPIVFVSGISPNHICSSCYRAAKSVAELSIVNSSKTLIQWTEHGGQSCVTCNLIGKKKCGGRKKKVNMAILNLNLT